MLSWQFKHCNKVKSKTPAATISYQRRHPHRKGFSLSLLDSSVQNPPRSHLPRMVRNLDKQTRAALPSCLSVSQESPIRKLHQQQIAIEEACLDLEGKSPIVTLSKSLSKRPTISITLIRIFQRILHQSFHGLRGIAIRVTTLLKREVQRSLTKDSSIKGPSLDLIVTTSPSLKWTMRQQRVKYSHHIRMRASSRSKL